MSRPTSLRSSKDSFRIHSRTGRLPRADSKETAWSFLERSINSHCAKNGTSCQEPPSFASVLLLLRFQFRPTRVESVNRFLGGLEPGVAGLQSRSVGDHLGRMHFGADGLHLLLRL